MTSLLRVVWSLSLVALIIGLVYTVRQSVDANEHERYLREVRRVQQGDTNLNELVLQTRSGQLAHYDTLTASVRDVERGIRALKTLPAFVNPHYRAEISKQIALLGDTFDRKRKLVETLKSDAAVLKNSLSYFPFVATDLAIDVDRMPEGKSTAAKLNALVRDVLVFNLVPDGMLRDRAEKELDDLESLGVLPGLAANVDLEVLVRHAKVILARKPRVEQVSQGIFSLDTRERASAIEATYASVHHASLGEASSRRSALFVLALIAIASGAGDVIARLNRSARALRETGQALQAANAALREEQEKEKELGELKSRFITMASHEFRTPLSVILSSSDLLEAYGHRWSDAKRLEHFDRIRSAIRGMTELLEGVLLIGKADAGVLSYQPREFELYDFCATLAEDIQLSAGHKHSILFSFEGDHAAVHNDDRLLRHVLTNLLSNAIKYSPAGGAVRFHVAASNSNIQFEVEDSGIGIPADDLPRLFESFHRARNVGTISGTGIGLAVVKRSLATLGGTISVRSTVAKGTAFTVLVPVREIA